MLRSLVALGAILLFAAYAIGSHYVAMLMYWWFGIFRPHEWMWWDLSSWRLPLVAAVLFVVPVMVAGKLPVVRGPIPVLILIFLGITLIGPSLAGCPVPAIWNRGTIPVLVFVALLSARLLTTENGIAGLMAVSGLSLCYTAATSGWASSLGGGHLYDVVIGGGAFTGTNAYALGTAIAVFLLASVYQHVRAGFLPGFLVKRLPTRLVRSVCSITLLMMMAGSALFIINTQSRGSALAFALGAVVWILLHRRTIRLLTMAAVLGALAMTVVPLPTGYVERITGVFDDSVEQDMSAASRPHFWRTAQMMADDNLFGVGAGCFSAYYDAYDDSDGAFGRRRSVHSSHYLIVAEQGYLGAAAWFALLATTLFKLFSIRRAARPLVDRDEAQWRRFHISNGLITGLVVFIAGASFYEFVYNDLTWLIFAMTIGLRSMDEAQQPSGVRSPDKRSNGPGYAPIGGPHAQTRLSTSSDGTPTADANT